MKRPAAIAMPEFHRARDASPGTPTGRCLTNRMDNQ
jgi:hypothetical protein